MARDKLERAREILLVEVGNFTDPFSVSQQLGGAETYATYRLRVLESLEILDDMLRKAPTSNGVAAKGKVV